MFITSIPSATRRSAEILMSQFSMRPIIALTARPTRGAGRQAYRVFYAKPRCRTAAMTWITAVIYVMTPRRFTPPSPGQHIRGAIAERLQLLS